MTANIVVPADGSAAAEAAAWYAGALAEGRRGAVHVVAAFDEDRGGEHTILRLDDAQTVLVEVQSSLRAAGLRVHAHLRSTGIVAALVAVAAAQDAELIVVPAGWTGLARELRWRAACRVDMLVVDGVQAPGFRPLPVSIPR